MEQEIERLKAEMSKLEQERDEWRSSSLGDTARIKSLEQEVTWFKNLIMELATIRK